MLIVRVHVYSLFINTFSVCMSYRRCMFYVVRVWIWENGSPELPSAVSAKSVGVNVCSGLCPLDWCLMSVTKKF